MKQKITTKISRTSVIIIAMIILIIIGIFISYNALFGAPQGRAELEQFTMPLGSGDFKELSARLKEKGFIKSEIGFKIAYFKKNGIGITATTCVDCFTPGAYKISKSMNAWELAKAIRKPYMKWVVIPEGLRKEQIAELLAKELDWTDQEKDDWINKYTAMKYDEIEGVYFPDTYLLPKDETGLEIADRLRAKFNEEFAPYADKFQKANIKWTTALKIASIVQREAAGKHDMPLIAGILWNRLLKDMKLDIDATVQYARDTKNHFADDPCENPEYRKDNNDFCFNPSISQPTAKYISEGEWWKPIAISDKQIDSKYNAYIYKGLPPHPISNPGIDAIDAVLNSTETECLYYLHDPNGQIHCAKTYEEHQANIATYLK